MTMTLELDYLENQQDPCIRYAGHGFYYINVCGALKKLHQIYYAG